MFGANLGKYGWGMNPDTYVLGGLGIIAIFAAYELKILNGKGIQNTKDVKKSKKNIQQT